MNECSEPDCRKPAAWPSAFCTRHEGIIVDALAANAVRRNSEEANRG